MQTFREDLNEEPFKTRIHNKMKNNNVWKNVKFDLTLDTERRGGLF